MGQHFTFERPKHSDVSTKAEKETISSKEVFLPNTSETRTAADSSDKGRPVAPVHHHACTVQLAAPGTFKPVALASLPGSGNTWVRHLIEEATGYYTGSVFHDSTLYESGFIGEYEDKYSGTTLTIKTHSPGTKGQFAELTAAILLLRSPFDVILTERNRRSTRDHVGLATWKASLRFDTEWQEFVDDILSGYERRVSNWLLLSEMPVLVVHYENVKADPVKEIEKIAKFLKFPLREERLDCVRENVEGSFHRNVTDSDKEKEYNVFTTKTKYDVLMSMNRVAAMLPETSPLPWKYALSPYLGNLPNIKLNTPVQNQEQDISTPT
ncbi:sialate:O-sulfotransferase 1-like [Glandiceps talaboti]